MKNKKNWAIALILTIAAGFLATQSGISPEPPAAVTETTSNTAGAEVPSSVPAYQGCSYTWAYHDAPELTNKAGTMIAALDPKANTRASLYGEDCIYADGHADFSVLETDFYVRLPVENLTDEKFFGDWMAQVMPLITQIPREEIQGNYGFVEFWFENANMDHVVVRVPIKKYMDESQKKDGIELYKMFSSTHN